MITAHNLPDIMSGNGPDQKGRPGAKITTKKRGLHNVVHICQVRADILHVDAQSPVDLKILYA